MASGTGDADNPESEATEYLKQVSRIKHEILSKYLGAWSSILGTKFSHLAYFDCFAGSNRYVDEHGRSLEGSPQHALKVASDFVSKSTGRSLTLGFIERDEKRRVQLLRTLKNVGSPSSVSFSVFASDARDLVDQMIEIVNSQRTIIPSFFFVDPYGYPLSVPILRRLLELPKAEVFVNLMWYRINMDLANSSTHHRLDRLFGHENWIKEDFNKMRGLAREEKFVDYFQNELGSRYHVPFPMTYSPEDRVSAPARRRKYYLIHFSRHHAAPLAMKEVKYRAMGRLEEIHEPKNQLRLGFEARDRRLDQLKSALRKEFTGKTLTFESIRIQTANCPFASSEYRKVIKEMEISGYANIERRQSKRDGLSGMDLVTLVADRR